MGASRGPQGRAESKTLVPLWGTGLSNRVGDSGAPVGAAGCSREPEFPANGDQELCGKRWGGHGPGPSHHRHPAVCWLSAAPSLCALTQASLSACGTCTGPCTPKTDTSGPPGMTARRSPDQTTAVRLGGLQR